VGDVRSLGLLPLFDPSCLQCLILHSSPPTHTPTSNRNRKRLTQQGFLPFRVLQSQPPPVLYELSQMWHNIYPLCCMMTMQQTHILFAAANPPISVCSPRKSARSTFLHCDLCTSISVSCFSPSATMQCQMRS